MEGSAGESDQRCVHTFPLLDKEMQTEMPLATTQSLGRTPRPFSSDGKLKSEWSGGKAVCVPTSLPQQSIELEPTPPRRHKLQRRAEEQLKSEGKLSSMSRATMHKQLQPSESLTLPRITKGVDLLKSPLRSTERGVSGY